MQARCRLLWRNLADEATLSAPGAAENFPAVMLQDHDPGMLCKSQAGPLVIQGSWPSAQTCTCLALLRHNLGVAGSISLTTDAGQEVTAKPWLPMYPFGRGPFGRGPLGGYPSARERQEMMPLPIRIIYFDQPLRFSGFSLSLADPGQPDGQVELGRLFLGPHLEAVINYRWGYGFGFSDPSAKVTLPTGGERFQVEDRLAELELEFDHVPSASAYSDFLRFLYVVGQSVPFIVDPEPEGPSHRRFWLQRYMRSQKDMSNPFAFDHRGDFKLSLKEYR